MGYTTPRSWSPGETVTASIMNVHVRDQFNVLAAAKVLVFPLGGPGAEVAVDDIVPLRVPFDCTITGYSLFSVGGACSIVLDVWKDTWANYPPTVADTIAGSEKPTLSSESTSEDTSLSTWTVDIDAGDVIFVHVDSASGAEHVVLEMPVVVR